MIERAPGSRASGVGAALHALGVKPGQAVHQAVVDAAEGFVAVRGKGVGRGDGDQVETRIARRLVNPLA